MFSNMLQFRFLEACLGGGLVLALLVVFLVDPGRGRNQRIVNDLEVKIITDLSSSSTTQKQLRLAVTPTQLERDKLTGLLIPWDDMTKLLTDLGPGYSHYKVVQPNELLANPNLIKEFDVLFLTCAPRGQELRQVLNEWVSAGGTLYASDWRFEAVAAAFPDHVDHGMAGMGTRGMVMADVVEPSLRDVLGPKVELKFDLPMWKTAAFKGAQSTVLLQGNYYKMRNQLDTIGAPAFAPLLVRFQVGKGTVIFTSFHNEKQNSDVEKKLLEYLVFSLMTAGLDADLKTSMSDGGFESQKSNLLSTPKGEPTVTKTYDLRKEGPLRFALAFRKEGAKLRLLIESPDGKKYQWEGDATVVLEVPRARSGEWKYSVTAVHLPYDNFPFKVTVSEKK